jgi:hypothetical protein
MVKPTESILDHFSVQSPPVSIEPVVTEPLKSAPVKSIQSEPKQTTELGTESTGVKRKEDAPIDKDAKKPKQVKQYCMTSYISD